jgi:dipeptidyl aminopeptidase/acylaminoacyl peptidase
VLWNRPAVRKRLDFATLATRDEEPQRDSAPAAVGDAAPSRQARSPGGDVAIAAWNDREATLTVSRRDASQATMTCSAQACRRDPIRWLAWRPGADQLVFTTADRARVQTVHLWDLPSGRLRTLWAGDGLLSGGRDPETPCALGPAYVACVAAGPTSPPRLMLLDLAKAEARTAHDPNSDLRLRAWPRHERLTWQGSGGQLFTGIMFLPPPGAAPAPLFINYYLCDGFVRGGVGDEWPFAALAAAGIVSVCVNATRAAAGDDNVGRYRAAEEGVRTLIDLLAGRGLIDGGRVGMGGLSFGSEVTMWIAMHTGLIAAASVASPQFEPANYWFNNVRGRDHRDILRRFWGLGAPDETPDQWRLLSPALNVERIRAPILFQLPEQEARYAVEFYARLSNSPTPTEMYVFPDERHVKTQPRHRLAVYRRNLDWFRFWLQGHVDSDPAKADQYRRWRALEERVRTESGGARP